MNEPERGFSNDRGSPIWLYPKVSSILCNWYNERISGDIGSLRRMMLIGFAIFAPSLLVFRYLATSDIIRAVLVLLVDIGLALMIFAVLCDARAMQLIEGAPPDTLLRSGLMKFNLRIAVLIALFLTPCSFLGAMGFLLLRLLNWGR